MTLLAARSLSISALSCFVKYGSNAVSTFVIGKLCYIFRLDRSAARPGKFELLDLDIEQLADIGKRSARLSKVTHVPILILGLNSDFLIRCLLSKLITCARHSTLCN